jgi:putative methyltransferase (TIGR04325 family)
MNQTTKLTGMKRILSLLIPPLLIRGLHFFRKGPQIEFSGSYLTWEDAKSKSEGYESPAILEKCKQALLKVKNGEAPYERDSVVFNDVNYNYGLLAGLLRCALENNGKLSVLDFGGSLGSTYYQNKDFLNGIAQLEWSIVEQTHFVECGHENFEDEQLKFYKSVEDCLINRSPNLLILSGVLQYLDNPAHWISKFVNMEFPYIIVSRTPFIDSEQDVLSVQTVPPSIYEASFPHFFFSEKVFLRQFLTNNFTVISTYPSFTDEDYVLKNGKVARWEDFIFKRL